jgi:hypothetical protein
VNTNFDSYPLLRIQKMPQVEVHFALSGGAKWGGIGELLGRRCPAVAKRSIELESRPAPVFAVRIARRSVLDLHWQTSLKRHEKRPAEAGL